MFKRRKKLEYKLRSDPTKSIDLDDDALVTYSIGFFTGITAGGNKCDKDSVELAKHLLYKLRLRGLDDRVFSSYNISYMTKFDLNHIPNPLTLKKNQDRHPLQEGYMSEGKDEDPVPTTDGSGLTRRNEKYGVSK